MDPTSPHEPSDSPRTGAESLLPAHRADPVGQMSTHRVEALADGVFAIIMTLLVFDIRVPEVPADQLPAALLELVPNLEGYLISFVLLGIYWIGHRNQFNFIRRADQNLHWLNILFFGLAGMVPFSTGLVARYPGELLVEAMYGFNLMLIGVALFLHWSYATRNYRLVDPEIPRAAIRLGKQRSLLAPACYLVAILVGLINPRLSLVVYALVPLLYIFPGLQHFWTYLAHR
jgi:uncharacterized membrane protein